ncbi:hypothetical protein P7C73_g5200, partial [Tremellales sp. Uapishka_1]
ILLTPDDVAQQAQAQDQNHMSMNVPLDEPLVLDPALNNIGGGGGGTSSGSLGEDGVGGYFEGVVGLHKDGTAMLEAAKSPYRYPTSPSKIQPHPHPYRRPSGYGSPSAQTGSSALGRSFSPSGMGNDGRPEFAMPFAPNGFQQREGLLAPPMSQGDDMEKSSSGDGSDPQSWQRWSVLLAGDDKNHLPNIDDIPQA